MNPSRSGSFSSTLIHLSRSRSSARRESNSHTRLYGCECICENQFRSSGNRYSAFTLTPPVLRSCRIAPMPRNQGSHPLRWEPPHTGLRNKAVSVSTADPQRSLGSSGEVFPPYTQNHESIRQQRKG